jgi:penicillin-binding protein-related factor A (putative recombinase)
MSKFKEIRDYLKQDTQTKSKRAVKVGMKDAREAQRQALAVLEAYFSSSGDDTKPTRSK